MVHGPVLTRERAPRAVSDTMLERSVPHLFSSFFFSIPSPRRALASDISSYILAISRYFSRSSSFLRYLSPSSRLLLFSLLFYTGNDSPPRISPFTRARYRLDTFSIVLDTLSRFFMRFCHFCFWHINICLLNKIFTLICERTNFIMRKKQV